MKKSLCAVLILAIMLSLFAGCGKSQSTTPAGSSTPEASAGNNASAKAPAVLRWHSANAVDNPRTEIGNFMKEKIAEKTSDLVIEVYPNAQLGSSDEVHAMIASGENIASATDAAWFSSMQPGFDIVNGPFFTETEDELLDIAKTEWFKKQVAELEPKGIKILATNWVDGSRFLMTKKPVRTPTDLKGMKIRVPNNKVAINIMNAMGATATPMALTEMYTALSQGVIDGAENPFSTLYSSKTHEVCKYLSLTGHQKMLSLFFVSTTFYNSLTDEAKKALTEVANEAGEYFSKTLMPKSNAAALEEFKKAGVTVIEDVDIKAFKEATLGVYENWSVDTYNLIQKQLSEVK